MAQRPQEFAQEPTRIEGWLPKPGTDPRPPPRRWTTSPPHVTSSTSNRRPGLRQRWGQEEDDREFHIGVCQGPTRPATVLTIEAARNMCGGDDELALELLRMAVLELEGQL